MCWSTFAPVPFLKSPSSGAKNAEGMRQSKGKRSSKRCERARSVRTEEWQDSVVKVGDDVGGEARRDVRRPGTGRVVPGLQNRSVTPLLHSATVSYEFGVKGSEQKRVRDRYDAGGVLWIDVHVAAGVSRERDGGREVEEPHAALLAVLRKVHGVCRLERAGPGCRDGRAVVKDHTAALAHLAQDADLVQLRREDEGGGLPRSRERRRVHGNADIVPVAAEGEAHIVQHEIIVVWVETAYRLARRHARKLEKLSLLLQIPV
eukprot:COSAG04_NODE_1026_length_8694_cov_2.500407_2_plen_261_part_00